MDYQLEVYTNLPTFIFRDVSRFIYSINNSFNLDDYNTTQKIVHTILNNTALKNIYGSQYAMKDFNDFLFLFDNKENKVFNFDAYTMDDDIIENEVMNKHIAQTLEMIKDLQIDEDTSLSNRYEYFENNALLVNVNLTKDEKIIYNHFLSLPNNRYVNSLSNSRNVKDLLINKINDEKPIEIKITESYMEHYQTIKTNFPVNFFEDFKEYNEFKKIHQSLYEDFNLSTILPRGIDETKDNYNFLTFFKGNDFVGGGYISEIADVYYIYGLDILNKYSTIENVEDCLMKSFSILPLNSNIVYYGELNANKLLDASLNNLKSKLTHNIYTGPSEIESFLTLKTELEAHHISKNDQTGIINNHYSKIIPEFIDKTALYNSHSFTHNLSLTKLFIKNNNINLNKNAFNENMNRQEFINKCVFDSHDIKDYKLHLLVGNRDIKYCIHSDESNNPLMTEEIHNKFKQQIMSLLKNIDINLNIHQLLELDNHIYKNTYKSSKNKQLEYSFNNVFDFLCHQKIVKKDEKSFIYRLESINDKGIYNDEKSGKYIKSDRTKNIILNMYDRRRPNLDKNLEHIFTNDSEYYRKKNEVNVLEYHDEWFFGFTDKEQLKKWFSNDDLFEFSKLGDIQLVKYEINNNFIIPTKHQVAFKKKEAIKIETLNLNSLLNTSNKKNNNIKSYNN